MKKTLILLFVAFLLKNEVGAQKWAVSITAKKQLTDAPHRNANADYDKHTYYQIGLDRILNKRFGINASVSYLHLTDANYFLEAKYNDTLILDLKNKIASNIFQFKVSPFWYITYNNRNQLSVRPSIGLGFVKTNQTIFNELSRKNNPEIVTENYSYKTKILPSFGIGVNYNYIFSNNWSLGASINLEQISSKTSKYETISTSEQPLNRFPTVTHGEIIDYRDNIYRRFGSFTFLQIGLEVKKYF